MGTEQLIGIVVVAIGVYFFVCATWKRDFVLYELKTRRAVKWYGERAHTLYQCLGVGAVVLGIVKALGYV